MQRLRSVFSSWLALINVGQVAEGLLLNDFDLQLTVELVRYEFSSLCWREADQCWSASDRVLGVGKN